MPFEVHDNKSGKLYFVYSINFYAMGSVNPDVKFLLWDVADQCWRVDYAANYIPKIEMYSTKAKYKPMSEMRGKREDFAVDDHVLTKDEAEKILEAVKEEDK